MALVLCPECKHEVSERARACPQCGCPLSEVRTRVRRRDNGKFLIFLVASVLVAAIVFEIKNRIAPQPTSSSIITPEEDKALIEGEKAERNRKFQLALAGALAVKSRLRNPNSLVIESAFVVFSTDAVCLTYRAQNGFGGMDRAMAVLVVDKNIAAVGNDSKTIAVWNRECADPNKGVESIEHLNTALRYTAK